MTENLKLKIIAGTQQQASTRTGQIFMWIPTECANNGACALNGSTSDKEYVNGYYYSWYAATAGTGTTSTVGDAAGSICPRGWIIPSDYNKDAQKSFGGLIVAYLQTLDNHERALELEEDPLNFSRAGWYNKNAFIDNGDGNYWSSTAFNESLVYTLTYRQSYLGISAVSGHAKFVGFTVRCVAM